MDDRRFDNLTRALAAGTSRRRLLRALGGAAAGGLLAARGGRSAGAAGKKVPICHLTSSATNPYTYLLVSDNPNGPHGKHAGDVIDVDLQANAAHCGACGARCPADQCNRATCAGGVCGLEPDPARVGQSCDDGDPCTDGGVCQADGACLGTPKACPACQTCQGGSCVAVADGPSCGLGEQCCGGACTDVTTTADCGACGNACGAEEICHAGACGPCGGLDRACCAGGVCEQGLTCAELGTCRDCGEVGEPCCLTFATYFCNAGAACLDVGGGQRQCGVCGGAGEPCCPFVGQECDPGLACNAGTCDLPHEGND